MGSRRRPAFAAGVEIVRMALSFFFARRKRGEPRRALRAGSDGARLHHEAAEALGQARGVEVQQQADTKAAEAEIRSQLHFVNGENGHDGLDFEDERMGDDDVGFEAVADLFVFVEDGDWDLSGEVHACPPQLDGEALSVYGFQQSGAEMTMHFDREADDLLG